MTWRLSSRSDAVRIQFAVVTGRITAAVVQPSGGGIGQGVGEQGQQIGSRGQGGPRCASAGGSGD